MYSSEMTNPGLYYLQGNGSLVYNRTPIVDEFVFYVFSCIYQPTGSGAETEMVLGSKVTMVAVTTLWKVSATTSKVARSHPGASARELLARATAPWALIVKLPEKSIFIQFTPVCMKI